MNIEQMRFALMHNTKYSISEKVEVSCAMHA